MVMRYYWGLAAGHTYTHAMHNSNLPAQTSGTSSNNVDETEDPEPETSSNDTGLYTPLRDQDSYTLDDDPELGFENRQDDFIGEAEIYEDELGIEDDEEFLVMNDMYGISYDY